MAGGALFAVAWLAAALALGGLALPLAARVFADLETRGAALAVPLGLAVLVLGTYWLGRLSFPAAPFAVVALLALVAAVVVRRDGVEYLPRRAAGEAAAVFAAGFLLVVLVGAVTPAITASGETFWNFALVQSLLRTGQLPPQDPWFAGEPVRYYYGGHLLIAALADLLDTPGRYAFVLGKATLYGALVVGAYGVAGAVAAARGDPRRPAALLGAFVVGLAGNLYTPLWGLLTALPDGVGGPLARAVTLDPASVTGATSYSVVDAAHYSFTNTDFPMYTVFLSGIHPHVASPPFLLLVVGVALAYHAAPAGARRRRLALLAAATPLVGLVALVNTWSLPTACGVVALAVALAPAHPRSLLAGSGPPDTLGPARAWAERAAAGGLAGLAVGGLGLLWVAPYVLRGLAGDPGVGVVVHRSGPWFFVIGYGGFLLVLGAFLVDELRGLPWSRRARRGAAAAGLGLVAVAWLGDAAGLALVGPLLLGGLALRARGRADPAVLLVVAGAGLVLLVEFLYVVESAEPGRINTVYKVFMQAWVLWSPAAGVALAAVARGRRSGPDDVDGGGTDDAPPVDDGGRRWRPAAVALVVVLLATYPLVGLGSYASYAVGEDVEPTLDGLAYLEAERPDYAAAIAWLADREGQPTIASAPVPERRLYRFTASPAASLTGVPTLVGWNHQADYRGDAAYRARVEAVDAIYVGSRAERARKLRAFDVRYVWLGDGERERYVPIDYSREPGIEVAFARGNVTVYRVEASALDAS